MARGDVFNQGVSTVAQNGYFNMQPPVDTECVVHNISHSTDAVLEYYDGTTSVPADAHIGSGSWMGMYLHCTNSKYYRVRNANASSNNICCDGIITK